MICIIAGNYDEALTWAQGQNLARNEWFYPRDELDLTEKENFHTIVVGSAGQNVSWSYFDKIYTLAQRRGSINRR